jgi:cysteine sulfinate desulfinase/cysteine desulfurase-like protein
MAVIENIDADYVCVSKENCVDNIISLCFKGVRGETIQHIMEAKGYIIGTGSACNSKIPTNRVISQIVNKDYIEGAIRISFDNDVTIEDCKNLALELSKAVKEYRERINK